MADVYLSHVQADEAVAQELAAALEAHGLSVWHPRPGETPAAALEAAGVVLVLASADALSDARMTSEVVHAHSSARPLVPVLLGLEHEEMAARQHEWRAALGAATSVQVPPEGVSVIVPRLVTGIRALQAARRPAAAARRAGRKQLVAVGAAALAVLLGTVVVVLGSGDDEPSTSGTPGSQASSTERVIPRTSASFSPGPLADASTTPLSTVAGRLRVTRVILRQELCSRADATCRPAPAGDRFVVVVLSEWDGRDIVMSDDLARTMDQSFVMGGERTATFTAADQQGGTGSLEVSYEHLPASAAGEELHLAWPGSPTLRVRVSG